MANDYPLYDDENGGNMMLLIIYDRYYMMPTLPFFNAMNIFLEKEIRLSFLERG